MTEDPALSQITKRMCAKCPPNASNSNEAAEMIMNTLLSGLAFITLITVCEIFCEILGLLHSMRRLPVFKGQDSRSSDARIMHITSFWL